jgi:hypothetical protein
MQSTYVDDDQHRDTVEEQSDAFNNDHLANRNPAIGGRIFWAFARFSVAVLIGVGATLAWQSYGDNVREALSTQFPSLRWLSVSTGTVTPDAQRSAQNTAAPQSVPPPQTAAPVAVSIPELAQLEPMVRDLAALRRSVEQLAIKQDQIIQNMSTLQAAQQDIKQKISRAVSPKPRPQPAQSPPVSAAPPVAQSPAQ